MRGLHINWTTPRLLNQNTNEYKMKQYKKLVQLLSILYWKKFYGDIILYTDKIGYEYYKNCGYPFLDLYNDVNIDLLDSSSVNTINPLTFWAGGKIFAVREEHTPFVMLDLDLFLTDDIKDQFKGHDIVFSHYETLTHPIYPNPKDIRGSYELPDYDWSLLPGNVCITYFGNEGYKDVYTREAIRYMRSHDRKEDIHAKNTSRMVFAEQRLLTCVANDMDIPFKPLIKDIYNSHDSFVKYNGRDLNTGEEPHWFNLGNSNIAEMPIHHTWGYKKMLINKGLKLIYVEQLQDLIKKDFPEYQKYLEDPNND